MVDLDPDPPPQLLPDDVLEEHVLRRLPLRGLAVASCVCRSWRAVVDARGALRRARGLLPLSVGGLFVIAPNRWPYVTPLLFFAPPLMRGWVASKLEAYLPREYHYHYDAPPVTVVDCCNGLLLVHGDHGDHVVNPATRRYANVLQCPSAVLGANVRRITLAYAYLAFDPSVSPNYEVVVAPDPWVCKDDTLVEEGSDSEWPPPACRIWIYSSGTGRWEERPFVREGGPAGTLAEVQSVGKPENRHAAYWRGALYVHRQSHFIMKMTLSDHKYQVIKLPASVTATIANFHPHLAKSKNGVYLGSVDDRFHLRVWILDESGGNTGWMLKYDIDLRAVQEHFFRNPECPVDRPWMILSGYGYNYNLTTRRGARRAKVKYQWSFKKHNILEIDEATGDENIHTGGITIFGFHPHRDLAFVRLSQGRVVACHLDSSMVQDLGDLRLPYGCDNGIKTTYVYTPCWMGDLSDHNW